MRIVDLRSIRTVVNVVERDYGKIQLDQTATVTVDGIADRQFTGRVIRQAPVLDPATRTARVMIEIANDDGLLKPGMHGRVIIVVSRQANALAVPASAIHGQPGSQFLYTVDETARTAMKQPVSVGFRDGDVIQVLTGLNEKTLVVTLGSRLIKDGAAVDFVETVNVPRAVEFLSDRTEHSASAGE